MARNSDELLAYIRQGRTMTRAEKLQLIVSLSVPSILAQISATVMFFIDAAMVGHLGEHATAAIGLVESTTWLMGGLGMAANMGFSVQVAHFIGANDYQSARHVLRQALACCLLWSLMLMVGCIAIHTQLPYWLGGSADIAGDASHYFMLIGVFGVFFQMEGLAGSMLKCSGNMKVPSILNIGMCLMDVAFNYLFIYIMDLGVMGAALGTGVAELITASLMLWFLVVKSPMLGVGARVRGYEGTEVRGYEGTEVRGYVGTEVRGYEGTGVRGYEGTEVRGYENSSETEASGLSEPANPVPPNNVPTHPRTSVPPNNVPPNNVPTHPRTSVPPNNVPPNNVPPHPRTSVPPNNVPPNNVPTHPRTPVPPFKFDLSVIKNAIKIGAPMGLQHVLMGGAQVVSTIIVAPLGTVAIATNSLAITVESLCYMPGFGIAEAATTLVGQGIGAGQKLLTRSLAHLSVGLGIAVMTMMGMLMWVFAPELMAIMSPVADIIADGADVLRIEAWAEPMFAAYIVCNGVFVGAANTLRPAIMSLASMWGVRLTLAAWLAPHYGLQGVWTAMAIELTFRGAIFLFRLIRGGWAKELSKA